MVDEVGTGVGIIDDISLKTLVIDNDSDGSTETERGNEEDGCDIELEGSVAVGGITEVCEGEDGDGGGGVDGEVDVSGVLDNVVLGDDVKDVSDIGSDDDTTAEDGGDVGEVVGEGVGSVGVIAEDGMGEVDDKEEGGLVDKDVDIPGKLDNATLADKVGFEEDTTGATGDDDGEGGGDADVVVEIWVEVGSVVFSDDVTWDSVTVEDEASD